VIDTAALAPDSHAELAEDFSIALLLILDRLSPLERAAFLLHDVFDFSFSEIASALGRSEAALNRRLLDRAKSTRSTRSVCLRSSPQRRRVISMRSRGCSSMTYALWQMVAGRQQRL
jgi:RNA polymerase sigma-70 factor (ECF subfamily)